MLYIHVNIFYHLQVVKLASETFNYSAIDRAKSKTKKNVAERFPEIGRKFHRLGLPPKVMKQKDLINCIFSVGISGIFFITYIYNIDVSYLCLYLYTLFKIYNIHLYYEFITYLTMTN